MASRDTLLAIRSSPFATRNYGLIDMFVAGPGVRIGSASRANSQSSERVLRGSITSSTQNFSAGRNGGRRLLRRAPVPFHFRPPPPAPPHPPPHAPSPPPPPLRP